MIKKIFGPPGTGKTTTLLNLVDDYVKKGTPLHRIGYFAFTRKAAEEAKERMLKRNPGKFKQKELRFFQTLHSLSFNSLGMSEDNVMQPVHYEQVGEELGVRVQETDESYFLNSNNEYFKLINKARVKKISVEDEYNTNEWSSNIDLTVLLYIYKNFCQFKEAYHLDDYTDMIEKFTKHPEKCPEFDVVFIDEAQDLAPIQWELFDILKNKTKDIYLAGDDDQAIFAWAGADVDRFVNEPADEDIVLNQSRRVPRLVMEQSQIIVDRIQGARKEKEYNPRDVEGTVQHIYSIDSLDLSEGEWLILGRTTYRCEEICKQLKENKNYFRYDKKPFFGKSFDTKLLKCIDLWTDMTKGESVTLSDFKDICEYLSIDFDENKLKNKSEIFISDIGYRKQTPWFDAFTNAPQDESYYIRTLLANGEKLREEPRIKVSTIHAAKGGECNNVVLILDNTEKIRRAMEINSQKQDEEHRVWYVGTTRAKENLYLLKPKIERKGYNL